MKFRLVAHAILASMACVFFSCADMYLPEPIVDPGPVLGGGEHFQFSDSIFNVAPEGAELETTVLNYEHFNFSSVFCDGQYYRELPDYNKITSPLLDAEMQDNKILITVKENTEKTDKHIWLGITVGNVYGYININQKSK